MKDNIIGAAIIGVLILLTFFCFSPIVHFLSKWDDYWNTDTVPQTAADSKIWRAENAAYNDCAERAAKYFNSKVNRSIASSTGDYSYKTYDCYSVNFKKIPNLLTPPQGKE